MHLTVRQHFVRHSLENGINTRRNTRPADVALLFQSCLWKIREICQPLWFWGVGVLSFACFVSRRSFPFRCTEGDRFRLKATKGLWWWRRRFWRADTWLVLGPLLSSHHETACKWSQSWTLRISRTDTRRAFLPPWSVLMTSHHDCLYALALSHSCWKLALCVFLAFHAFVLHVPPSSSSILLPWVTCYEALFCSLLSPPPQLFSSSTVIVRASLKMRGHVSHRNRTFSFVCS